MRKSTLLWLVLAAFCGIALFYTSQRDHDGREKLAALNQEAAREEESIRVLQAEWSYLNQPGRLEKLAKQYLGLAPMKGAQFIRPEDIAPRPAAAAPETIVSKHPHPNLLPRGEGTMPPLPLGEGRGEGTKAADIAKSNAAARKFGDVMKSLGVEQ